MKILSGNIEYFALDIGTTAVRAVQLARSGGGWSLSHYGMAPVSLRVATSDSPEDQKKLSETIMTVIGQSGITTKNVILGVPANKTFATVIDMPNMPLSEMAATIKYQADQYIPSSLDESKVDWALLGKPTPNSPTNEVLLVSVANSYVEQKLDFIESLGLNVIAIEPEPLAVMRALQPASDPSGKVIVDFGDFSTDIIITYADGPRLIRSIPTGVQSLVKVASQNLNVDPQQAQQFIMKFGVQQDKLEGQIYRVVESTVDQIAAEITKSVKFFQTKYPTIPLSQIIMSNYAVTVPGLGEYLAQKVGIQAQVGNPWQQVRVPVADQTNLQPLSSQFGVAVGLAQRGSA